MVAVCHCSSVERGGNHCVCGRPARNVGGCPHIRLIEHGFGSFSSSRSRAWFGSPVDWVLSLDLLIVALAESAFMIFEGRRLGMRFLWLYIGLSGVTAFAFTFPLFLAMRERMLAKGR